MTRERDLRPLRLLGVMLLLIPKLVWELVGPHIPQEPRQVYGRRISWRLVWVAVQPVVLTAGGLVFLTAPGEAGATFRSNCLLFLVVLGAIDVGRRSLSRLWRAVKYVFLFLIVFYGLAQGIDRWPFWAHPRLTMTDLDWMFAAYCILAACSRLNDIALLAQKRALAAEDAFDNAAAG